jgi:CBS domain-containing protein
VEYNVLVKEVMTKKVFTIDKNKTIFDACNMYKDYKIGCLIVTDMASCVGIITERDIIERTICARRDPYVTKIGDIMSKNMKTIHALETIDKAIEVMFQNKIKKLPVLINEEVVGIITVTDISRARPDISKRFMQTWVRSDWRD